MWACSLTWWPCCRRHKLVSSQCPQVPAGLLEGWSCGSPWGSAGPAAGAGSSRCWSCLGESDRRNWGRLPTAAERKGPSVPLSRPPSWSLNPNQTGLLPFAYSAPEIWGSCAGHAVALVSTLNKNLLAQMLLGFLFMHQQEQKLTVWVICCLGHGRWPSWLKAVGRKRLIRRQVPTELGNHGYCSVNAISG